MSDKKQLLEEGTIRRFMELANIKPLNTMESGVIEEAAKKPAAKKPAAEEPVKEGYAAEEESLEEADSMEEMGTKAHSEKPATMEEAEGEMEGGDHGEQVRAALEEIKSGVDKLVSMIEGAGGVGFEVEEEPEGGGEEAPEMPEMGGEEEGEEKEEASLEEKKEMEEESMEEALAEELTRRVAARLMREAKKGAVAKKGGNWLAKPSHAKPPKAKGSPVKGGTPFKGGKK